MLLNPDFAENLPKRSREGFYSFGRTFERLCSADEGQRPDFMIEAVLETGYMDYLLASFDNAQDRLEDIKELSNFAHGYRSLKSFLNDVSLKEGFKGETIISAGDRQDHIVLTTIHQAKGLEWNTVMTIGLVDGQFPHPKSFEDNSQLEEERRLFYVASTRAKEHLYMIYPMSRFDYNYGNIICRPSLFVKELPEDCYEKWDVKEVEYSDGL
jgi:DNA helicase-2/ATP-dependent DNA helicase PcrA